MAGGAPKGNNNATKNRPWIAAIKRALKERTLAAKKEALDELAEKLLSQCDDGNMTALQELGNRLDGKPHQSVNVSGEEGGPIKHIFEVVVVDSNDKEGDT